MPTIVNVWAKTLTIVGIVYVFAHALTIVGIVNVWAKTLTMPMYGQKNTKTSKPMARSRY